MTTLILSVPLREAAQADKAPVLVFIFSRTDKNKVERLLDDVSLICRVLRCKVVYGIALRDAPTELGSFESSTENSPDNWQPGNFVVCM